MTDDIKELSNLRNKLDHIDKEILILLEKRFLNLVKIKRIKKQSQLSLYDKKRESDLLKKADDIANNTANKEHLIKIYKNILQESLEYILK